MATSARLDQIRALLADDPADALLRYMLAMEHASLGDDAEAVRTFREILAKEPYVPAYHMAGQALIRLNDFDAAAAMLRDGLTAAQKQNDMHAYGEMEALLATVE